MFSQFAEYINSLSIVVAASVAIYGIRSWKREHVGRRRIDLSEEALALFYEARDVINDARTSLGSTGEWREAQKMIQDAAGEDSGNTDVLIVAFRLSCSRELFARIRALRYRFGAVFGDNTVRPFRDLVQLKSSVTRAERRLRDYERHDERVRAKLSDERETKREEKIKRLSAIVECGGEESDPTTQELDQIVEAIERVCRPVIDAAIPVAWHRRRKKPSRVDR